MSTGTDDSDDPESTSQLLGNDPEVESPDKWRRLATTPITTDPDVLRLQRSLATAAMDYEALSLKTHKKTKEADLRVEELSSRLSETSESFGKIRNDCNNWHCKYEGM